MQWFGGYQQKFLKMFCCRMLNTRSSSRVSVFGSKQPKILHMFKYIATKKKDLNISSFIKNMFNSKHYCCRKPSRFIMLPRYFASSLFMMEILFVWEEIRSLITSYYLDKGQIRAYDDF